MLTSWRGFLTLGACLSLFTGDNPLAPPAIAPGGVVNEASRMPATLPGGAIARGARISISGVRLGAADVSVLLRQGRHSSQATLLSATPKRIDAILPQNLEAGPAQLTVSSRGLTSEAFELQLVESSPGLYPTETRPSARPGERVTLRATGSGGIAPKVFIGEVPAGQATLAASTCCPGIEEISFTVPAGAPHGCFVPVRMQTSGGRVSNDAYIAVHPPGEPCRDTVDWFRASVQRAARAGFVALARASLDVETTPRNRATFVFDYGVSTFGSQQGGPRIFPPLPPPGVCTVFAGPINPRQVMRAAREPDNWTSIPAQTPGNVALDVGDELTLRGPKGTQQLPRNKRHREYYDALLGGEPPFSIGYSEPPFLEPGDYTVSAPGGEEVGAFSTRLHVTRPIQWTNKSSVRVVERARGTTVRWRAADPRDAVLIVAASADRPSGGSALCLCLVHAREGRFQLPLLALANLPPSGMDAELPTSYLMLMEIPVLPPARIEARGLDAGFAAFVSAVARLVKYQ